MGIWKGEHTLNGLIRRFNDILEITASPVPVKGVSLDTFKVFQPFHYK